MIRGGEGNLLEAQVDALVNTVNCVGVMGKGLALQFRKAFPDMFRAYKRDATAGKVEPGRMHLYHTGSLLGPRLIINFPTKRDWRARSRLDDIRAGMEDLVRVLRDEQVQSVAIPPLGAGLGGLDWSDVRPLIVDALSRLPEVDVLLWEPGAAPAPRERIDRRRRPEMTRARAMILALLQRYELLDHRPSHIEAQKLAYFLEVMGIDLGLKFQPHQYGPYSDRLYHLLQKLEGHQIFGLDDRKPLAELELDPRGLREAHAWLEAHPDDQRTFEQIADLIRGFETPYGLELLATAHWAATHFEGAAKSVEACIEAIGRWPKDPERKRKVMRPEHVALAHQRLRERDLIVATA